MTPIRIATRVADPPAPPAPEDPGVRRVADRCGSWPVIGTFADYITSVDRAWLELARLARLEDRYWRRFGRMLAADPLAPVRVIMWRRLAQQIAEGRAERFRLMIGPPGGEA